jgi:hypothetical protein
LQAFLEECDGRLICSLFHRDNHSSFITALLHDTLYYWIGESASPVLRKRSFGANDCLLVPGGQLSPYKRARIFFFTFFLALVSMNMLSRYFTYSYNNLISFKGFILVGTEICVGEGVEVNDI